MDNFFKKLFEKKIEHKNINKYCRELKMEPIYSKLQIPIKAACVQRRIKPVGKIEDYVDILYSFAVNAAEDDCQLLVFPEYNFFDLVGLLPCFNPVNKLFNWRAAKELEKEVQEADDCHEKQSFIIKSIFKGIAEPAEKALTSIISLLAEGLGLYIYSGSYLKKNNGKLYNMGTLYGPDGEVIGTQKKLHLLPFEEKLGLEKGEDLKVFSLPFGNTAFPICMDATYFETFEIASKKGADIVIIPIANMEEYNKWRAMRGIWGRVQESYKYGLKASLNGWLAGMHFTGKAGVFAPIEMTPQKNGIIQIADKPEGDRIVTGRINLQKLKKARENAQYYGDSNPIFEKYYTERTYKGFTDFESG